MVCILALSKTGFFYFTSFKKRSQSFQSFHHGHRCTVNQKETFVGGQDFKGHFMAFCLRFEQNLTVFRKRLNAATSLCA